MIVALALDWNAVAAGVAILALLVTYRWYRWSRTTHAEPPIQGLRGAAKRLLEAYERAQGEGRDVWDFAVEIQDLRSMGLTNGDLRWLVSKGYVKHAVEITRPGVDGRAFREGGNFSFNERTCVVLTDAGVAWAKAEMGTGANRGLEATEEHSVEDEGQGTDVVSRIDRFQSAGLLLHTRRLANLAAQSSDQEEIACVATAVILMATAAAESMLLEAAYLTKRELYMDGKFRRKQGVPGKFKMLTGDELQDVSPAGAELWGHRLALAHAEPDNWRTAVVGTRTNAAGALWAVETIESRSRARSGTPGCLSGSGGIPDCR